MQYYYIYYFAPRGIIKSSITYPAEKMRMDRKFLRINDEFAKFVKKNWGGGIFGFLRKGWGCPTFQENILKPPQDPEERIRSVMFFFV